MMLGYWVSGAMTVLHPTGGGLEGAFVISCRMLQGSCIEFRRVFHHVFLVKRLLFKYE